MEGEGCMWFRVCFVDEWGVGLWSGFVGAVSW